MDPERMKQMKENMNKLTPEDKVRIKQLEAEMKKLTPEERVRLREEKQKEIDELMNLDNIKKKTPDEPAMEEMSMEDFIKHPLFMDSSKIPTQEEIDDNEFMQAVQAMKYNEDDTLDDQANAYKLDGTFHFKAKLYRKACLAYTQAISINPPDKKLLAQCYNNRGAAQFFRKNFRQAIKDSGRAVVLDRTYTKAWFRVFDCCEKLQKWNEGLEMVEKAFDYLPGRTEETTNKIIKYREQFAEHKKNIEKKERKRKMEERKKEKLENLLIQKIRDSGVNLVMPEAEDGEDNDGRRLLRSIETSHPSGCQVNLRDGLLHWPVTFVYPEYQMTDFIESFAEDTTLGTMLTNMFAEVPCWDQDRKYLVENMNVWIENRKSEKLFKIDINAPLNVALRHKNSLIHGGCPSFIITIEQCPFEKVFKSKYKM